MHLPHPSRLQLAIAGTLGGLMVILGTFVSVLESMHLLGYIQDKFPSIYSILTSPGVRLAVSLVGMALLVYVILEFSQTRKLARVLTPDNQNTPTVAASTGPININVNPHFSQSNTQSNQQSVSAPVSVPVASRLVCVPAGRHDLVGEDEFFWTDEWGTIPAAVASIRNELGDTKTSTEARIRAEVVFRNTDRTQEQRVIGCWLHHYTQFATFQPADEHKLLLVTHNTSECPGTIWDNPRRTPLPKYWFRNENSILPLKAQSLRFNPAFITIRLFRPDGETRGEFYFRYEKMSGFDFTVTLADGP